MTIRSKAFAKLLLQARRTGQPIETAPAELVPTTLEEAYAVQDAVARRLGAIAGWKVGAPSPMDEPQCAPLFAEAVALSPASWSASRFRVRGIEGELAFRFARSLPLRSERYEEDEVWAAVDTLHPAIELVESRFSDMGSVDKLALLADNQSNGAFCYGVAARDWQAIDFLNQPASLLIDGREVASAVGGNKAGHPRRLLAWLANHCARRGRGLAAGDIVTTGTHTGLVFAAPGATATVRFRGLGEASLTLAT
jgi:2-keto-4-pentenoate hydratase